MRPGGCGLPLLGDSCLCLCGEVGVEVSERGEEGQALTVPLYNPPGEGFRRLTDHHAFGG